MKSFIYSLVWVMKVCVGALAFAVFVGGEFSFTLNGRPIDPLCASSPLLWPVLWPSVLALFSLKVWARLVFRNLSILEPRVKVMMVLMECTGTYGGVFQVVNPGHNLPQRKPIPSVSGLALSGCIG